MSKKLLRVVVFSNDPFPDIKHFLAARKMALKVAEDLNDWLVFVETQHDPIGPDGAPMPGTYGHVYETLAIPHDSEYVPVIAKESDAQE